MSEDDIRAQHNASRPVRRLPSDVARKIAAGEVIDRPSAIVRELIDNAIDSHATTVNVEIVSGGIDSVRVQDDGCGMTKEDLGQCARPHATSKIENDDDLLNLKTMGFRGEALASIAAVGRLIIISGGYRCICSITEDHIITKAADSKGTVVIAEHLFENFPARRHFLKRVAAETAMCRDIFIEKSLSRPDIKFTFAIDGITTLTLRQRNSIYSLRDRFVDAIVPDANVNMFNEVKDRDEVGSRWYFTAVVGGCLIYRPTRRDIYVYVNNRCIKECSLVQAIEYGAMGFFPNGTHPLVGLFVTMNSADVDFNIHPAKREARFVDIAPLHHSVSNAIRAFYSRNSAEHGGQNFTTHLSLPSSSTPLLSARYENLPVRSVADDSSDDDSSTNYNIKSMDAPHYLGAALGVFLLVEKGDTLYFIDQHAAHERLLYNAMIQGGQTQTLLVPYVLKTQSNDEDEYMKRILPALLHAGFDIHQCMPSQKNIFGGGQWEVWSHPVLWYGGEEDLSHAILDKQVDANEVIRSVAAASSCKSAIKDGTYLDDESARDLATSALALIDPHCPHGRPIWYAITKNELFHLVRRDR